MHPTCGLVYVRLVGAALQTSCSCTDSSHQHDWLCFVLCACAVALLQVLLSVASSPGLLPQQTANGLVDAALQLQMLVLPGVRSIMGPTYNPLAGLLGTDGLAAAGGAAGQPGSAVDAAAVAAAMRRQQQQRAAESNQMMSLVQQLKQLEAREGV